MKQDDQAQLQEATRELDRAKHLLQTTPAASQSKEKKRLRRHFYYWRDKLLDLQSKGTR